VEESDALKRAVLQEQRWKKCEGTVGGVEGKERLNNETIIVSVNVYSSFFLSLSFYNGRRQINTVAL
jgi:hypothetical protein